MTTRVTLNVFSGRPNPSWVLSAKDEKQLTDRMNALSEVTNQRPSGLFGGLGYRGFSIARSTDHPQGKLTAVVHESVVDHLASGINFVDNSAIESFLLETGRGKITAIVQAHVQERLTADGALQFTLPRPTPSRCPTCHAGDAPPYNPAVWNTATAQPKNNCYNYANNKMTNTFAQPGRAAGKPAKVMACAAVQAAAQADKLAPVANFSTALPKGKGWYVALVVWPNADYHWYRQDNVGCWSHKPGQTAARNVDNAGQPITDPKTCNRGPYINFCSYMVTRAGVVIK